MSKEYRLQFNLNNYISAEEPYLNDIGAVILGVVDDDSGILKVLFDSHKTEHIKFFIELIKYVTDLEAKLSECEKKFIVANNLRKNADEVLLNYKTEKYGLDKTIQELRKMKLSLPEKEWYYKGFENCERQMSSHIADLTLEVKELKQQLHDLPKKIVEEIRKWGQKHYNWVGDGTGYDGQDYNECIGFNMAIDQLNEILDAILKKFGGENE